MRPDPQRVGDTLAWLRRAVGEPRAAEVDPGAHPALLADAAFHCQQAAEKSLTAFLTWHDVPFRRTHDLAEPGRQFASLDSSIEPVYRRTERLTAYAWVFRYPGDIEEPARQEVEDALSAAREVYGAVLARRPGEVRP